jgi:hypothetical protein
MLKDKLLPCNLDLICIAETKIDQSFPDAQFALPNYRMFRRDNTNMRGGLLTYIRSDIPCRKLNDYSTKNVETIVMEVLINKQKWAIVFSYKTPSMSDVIFTSELQNILDRLLMDYTNVVVAGDLNFNMSEGKPKSPLHDLCDLYSLENQINEPTFYHSRGNSSIDVILTNQKLKIRSSGTINTHLSDGHQLIYSVLKSSAPKQPSKTIYYRSFKNLNNDNFLSDLQNVPFHISDIFDDPDDCYWAINNLLNDVLDKHVPIKKKTIRAKHTPFMNSSLRKAIMNKHRLWRKYKQFPSSKTWESYRNQRNRTTAIRKASIKTYFRERSDGGPRNEHFWDTIKPFITNKGCKNTQELMIEHNSDILTNPKDVADAMNKFYIDIASHIGADVTVPSSDFNNLEDYVNDSISLFKEHPSVKCINESFSKSEDFDFKPISCQSMYNILQSLDTSKATGYDDISAKILKLSSPVLYVPLTNLFNKCILNSIFPTELKCANVYPVYKKDNPMIKKNYRPVSVLTSISKVFEKLVAQQLCDFENCILHPYIAAFRKQYSCQSVLLKLTEEWRAALDKGKYVGTVLMDLSKAFDCMPHSLLVTKLHAYGMNMKSTKFLTSYLSGRKQRVKMAGITSDWLNVEKGVPQGSVLGPALFNIFINDIYGFILHAKLFNYADDNTLSCIANTIVEVKEILTKESKVAIQWFKSNMMEANPGKFQVMLLSKSKNETDFSLEIDGNILKGENHVKLLGVNIDKHMNFNYHVDELCVKAARQLNALGRLRHLLDQDSKIAILKSFITSNFNYCPLVWHFCGMKSTRKMECILKRALRFAYDDYVSSYDVLLDRSGLTTLELHRQRLMAIETYKIKNGLLPDFLQDLICVNNTGHNTRQSNKLKVPTVNSTYYGLHSFKCLSVEIWNCLTAETVVQPSLKTFKTEIFKWNGFKCKCAMCK